MAFLVVLPVMLGALFFLGIPAAVVEREAIEALERVLPPNLEARVGATRVVLNGFDGIAVSLDNLTLIDKSTGTPSLHVDKSAVGVKFSSLLEGKPRLDYLNLSGGELSVADASAMEWPAVASIERKLSNALHAAGRLFSRTSLNGAVIDLKLENLTIRRPGAPRFGDLVISSGKLTGSRFERQFEAEFVANERTVALAGTVRKSEAGAISLRVTAEGVPLPAGRLRTMLSAVEADHQPGQLNAPIPLNVTLEAYRSPEDDPDELTFSITPHDLSLKLDDGDLVPVAGTINAVWEPSRQVLGIRDSPVTLGRSSVLLSGAIRDLRRERAPDGPGYEFELLTNRGISDPRDSPVRSIRFAARTQGSWKPAEGTVRFDRIELDSTAGYVEGAGTIDLAPAVPTAVFALSIRDFAVAGVKQFWPAPVARGARRWVLANLAGGRVTEGEFLIAEPLRRRLPGADKELTGDSELSLQVSGIRFDVAGDIPAVRDADGSVVFKGGQTEITLTVGTAYLPSGRKAKANGGTLVIHPADASGVVMADLDMNVSGPADAIGEIITYRPINAQQFHAYQPEDLSGEVDARLTMQFALNRKETAPPPQWDVSLDVSKASIATPFEGRMLSELTGAVRINRERADIDVTGLIDGVPADIAMIQPFEKGKYELRRDIVLDLDDAARKRIAPGLEALVRGATPVAVASVEGSPAMAISADLTSAQLSLPWIGWMKGSGIGAKATFDLVRNGNDTHLENFSLDGDTFSADGDVRISPAGLQLARFGKVRLNEADDVSISIERKGRGFSIDVRGASFDARALLRHVRELISQPSGQDGGTPVDLTASVAAVTGFGGETMRNLKLAMRHDGRNLVALSVSGLSASGFPVSLALEGAGSGRTVRGEALDAGEVLRFLDVYGQVRGGVLEISLGGQGESGLAGAMTMRDFRIFNEPRLNSIVSTRANNSRSLSEAVNRNIDTSEVKFDLASARVSIGPSSLQVADGVVRGPVVGSTFQGTVFDADNRMRITGTFLPAYGLNSLFAEIPVLGLFLGNGRDRGLIGVTYLLEGDAKKPEVSVNPLSVIAPGVFRSIFEYR
ncbi:DUF3971 domain-containing protein [Oricola cellulosilytica]|nr:DUF3971 domain-containing protein [Oricola cellulosilytica]